jgi:hypothetical protein
MTAPTPNVIETRCALIAFQRRGADLDQQNQYAERHLTIAAVNDLRRGLQDILAD